MALNHVMLRSNGQPVPLPEEKLFAALENVQISLQQLAQGHTADTSKPAIATKASGRAYVTSKRIICVADVALSSSSAPFTSLSIPLSHIFDGRLIQPIFGYAVGVKPVAQGGLSAPQLLTITFKEGKSWDWVQAIEECKRRFDEASGPSGTESEALPVYQADEQAPAPGPRPSGSTQPVRRPTIPESNLIEAANAARLAEAAEADSSAIRIGGSELPPAYDDSTRP